MEGRPFALVGVNSDDSVETAQEAVKKNELNWRSFQNERKDMPAISDDWKVSGWPTIVVMDENGIIKYRGHDGHAATEMAAKLVAKLEKGEEEVVEEKAIGTEKGQFAPNITGVDLDGKSFSLADYEGQVILLDFWGDW
ncbi:MAG: thioredoxin-like domain-containing protein [Planctomycetota bacterium]|jgi:osmotically-inducible protein OsmY|nr:thioredoxin-like domain-containing protein [Planctomycetota bacterium]